MDYEIIIIIPALLLLLLCYLFYYELTVRKKTIKISHKYKVNTNGNETLKFIDTDKLEYVISEGVMISKKRCNNLWNKIKEGSTYKIEYYGFNLWFIDFNYKVVEVEEVEKVKFVY